MSPTRPKTAWLLPLPAAGVKRSRAIAVRPEDTVRLGELLIAAGWATAAVIDAALAQQRERGARLGAILVDSGALAVDDVARALARQHGVPAALERHLSARDPALAQVVPGAVAVAIGAVPVAWSRGAQGMSLVVCFRDPTPAHIAELARVTGVPVIPAVACERVIVRELRAAYPEESDAPAPDDADDVDDASVDVNFDEPSAPAFTLVELDHGSVQRDFSQVHAVPTRGGNLLPTTQREPRIAPPPPPPPPAAIAAAPTLDATLAALAAAPSRDAIADLAIAFARGAWRGAVVLMVREGLAVGHRGFGGHTTEAALGSLVIPLGQPSMFTTAHDERRALVGPPPPGGLAQSRFLKLFAPLLPAPVAVVPVAVRERVVNLLFAVAPVGAIGPSAAVLGEIAAAMGDAYERVIRDSKR